MSKIETRNIPNMPKAIEKLLKFQEGIGPQTWKFCRKLTQSAYAEGYARGVKDTLAKLAEEKNNERTT